jgi:8-oxo-dGTP diphosphatase
MSKVELTNMIMIQNPETLEVVVQKRVKYWCGCTFPGGHVENGESIYDSAVREAKEETGLLVRNLKYCGMMHWHNTDNNDKYFVHFYKTTDYTGELIDKTDEGEVFFSSIEDLMKMELSPNFDKYLTMFLSDDYSEIFCNWNEEMKKDGEPEWEFQFK